MSETEGRGAGANSGVVLKAGAGLAVLIAGIAVCWLALAYNQLVALETGIDGQWKQVENQLVRQHELLPKLVEVTKGYARYERGTLERIAELRVGSVGAPPRELAQRATELDRVLVATLALPQAHPELKADRSFRDLAFEIAGTKNRIAVERKRYNDLVASFEAKRRQLPWRFVSAGFSERHYYDPPEAKLAEPELGLSSL